MVISIPKLRPTDPTAASQETFQLFCQDNWEKHTKQQILLSGERQERRFPVWGRVGSVGLLVWLAQFYHWSPSRPHCLPQDIPRGCLWKAESKRQERGGRCSHGVHWGDELFPPPRILTTIFSCRAFTSLMKTGWYTRSRGNCLLQCWCWMLTKGLTTWSQHTNSTRLLVTASHD